MKKRFFVGVMTVGMVLAAASCAWAEDTEYSVSQQEGAEESVSLPPEEDYDELVLFDGRYYLCEKNVTGFDVNTEYYGIYDGQAGEWAYPLQELPMERHLNIVNISGGDSPEEPTSNAVYYDFISHGEGVFSYKHDEWGDLCPCFMSASLSGYFSMTVDELQKNIHFINGEAFVLVRENQYSGEVRTFINGEEGGGSFETDTHGASSRICRISVDGELTEVSIPGYETQEGLEWSGVLLSLLEQDTLYATSFYTYNSGELERGIYVFRYDTGEAIVLKNTEYFERLELYFGVDVEYTNSRVMLQGDLIRVERLKGDDGNYYYAEFDWNGQLVTEATLME